MLVSHGKFFSCSKPKIVKLNSTLGLDLLDKFWTSQKFSWWKFDEWVCGNPSSLHGCVQEITEMQSEKVDIDEMIFELTIRIIYSINMH